MSADANLMLGRVDRDVVSLGDRQEALFETEKRLRGSLEVAKDGIGNSSKELMKFDDRAQPQFPADHSDVRGAFAWNHEKQHLAERTGVLEQVQEEWRHG